MTFKWKLSAAAMALSIGLAPVVAGATELTLFHTWSNESEMAALNSIVKAFEAKGNKVTSASVPHETAGESPLVSLFVAGTPPNLFIAADAGFFKRPRQERPGPGRRTALRQDRCDQGLPRDGAEGDHHRRQGPEDPDRRAYRRHGLLQHGRRQESRGRSDQVDFARRHVGRRGEGREGRVHLHCDRRQYLPGRLHLPSAPGGRGRAGHLQSLLRRHRRRPRQDRVRREGSPRRYRGVPQDRRADRSGLGQPRLERHHQHGDRGQGPHADPRRLDEGPVESERQDGRQGFRLHQHPRHQGALGDGRLLRDSRRRRARHPRGGGGFRQHRRRPEGQCRVRVLQGLQPGAPRRPHRQARRLQHAGPRFAEEARISASRIPTISPTATGSIRSGTRCSPSRAIRK